MYSENQSNGIDNKAFERGTDDHDNNISKTAVQPEPAEQQRPPSKPQRDQWGSGIEFLMSCIAMSVGLGNIWRFPFIANRNGGGAFLIPYLIVLTIVGRPMYYMEMALGQFSSKGNLRMFEKLSPVLKGIGYGQCIALTCVSTYYCSIMAVTLFYFFNSFTSYFPWATCRKEWEEYANNINKTCVDQHTNISEIGKNVTTISSSELFFKREVLKEYDNVSDGIGVPDWKLSLLLLTSWAIVLLVTIKGVKSSGKASYFLALFPYVIMITLLIRAATLPGAADGMYYFIETDWNRLLDAQVWYAAVTQCFFSLNVGFGEIIMLSSYNNFNHDISRDALIITTLDTFTSLLSGVTIFGILGNLAYEMGVHPRNVISGGGGTGLAFVSYPDAISKFEHVPWLFSILFFLMLFILGVGSQAALHNAINTAIKDSCRSISQWKIATCTAIVGFLIGLVYCTPGGQHVLELVDHFGGTLIVFPCAILETISVAWLYGVENFCLDLEFMTKKKVGIYWRVCWGVLLPGLLIVVFIYFLATLQPLTYGLFDLEYPIGLAVVGWSIFGITIIQMILWVIYYLWVHREYPCGKMVRKTFSTKTWIPENEQTASEWKLFKSYSARKRVSTNDHFIIRKLKVLIGK